MPLLLYFIFSFIYCLHSYNRGAIPTSINMPYSTSFAPDGSLVPTPEANVLNSNRGKIIVVVGNRGDSAVKVTVTRNVYALDFCFLIRNSYVYKCLICKCEILCVHLFCSLLKPF